MGSAGHGTSAEKDPRLGSFFSIPSPGPWRRPPRTGREPQLGQCCWLPDVSESSLAQGNSSAVSPPLKRFQRLSASKHLPGNQNLCHKGNQAPSGALKSSSYLSLQEYTADTATLGVAHKLSTFQSVAPLCSKKQRENLKKLGINLLPNGRESGAGEAPLSLPQAPPHCRPQGLPRVLRRINR